MSEKHREKERDLFLHTIYTYNHIIHLGYIYMTLQYTIYSISKNMQGLQTYFVQSALVDDHSASLIKILKAQLFVCY